MKNKKLYILTYDHGGYVLWKDEIKPRLLNIFDWLEKYPKLRIGLDYEPFTFDEFSKCDKEVVELTQPIEEVTAHIETKDNYGYALLEDIPSLYGEPVDEYRTTDNDLHFQIPLFLLVSVIIPTKISQLKFLQNLAKLSPKRICL